MPDSGMYSVKLTKDQKMVLDNGNINVFVYKRINVGIAIVNLCDG